jgi:hypothetical protein
MRRSVGHKTIRRSCLALRHIVSNYGRFQLASRADSPRLGHLV